MILGDIFGALALCFPASGETFAFSFGFFPSKGCSFSLVLLWRFVCRLLALFFFWLVGCLCGRLGLALGSPGLVGPPWPGIILVVFLGRLFGARNGHMDSAEMHKNK